MSVTNLKVDLNNVAGDRIAIDQCATFVRRRIDELAAAETWIACGERLNTLKTKNLLKSSPRGDNERIGWNQAFQLEPRAFPFGRRHADRLIKVYEVFNGHGMSTKKLPASVGALHLLATKFNLDQINQCIVDGSISSGSTEAEVSTIGRKLKLIKPKNKQKKDDPLKRAPKRERIAAVWELMARLNLKVEDLTE